jgi:hypothetical protein
MHVGVKLSNSVVVGAKVVTGNSFSLSLTLPGGSFDYIPALGI